MLAAATSPAYAVFYQVSNYAADSFLSDGRCSLREALYAIRYRVPTDNCPAGDAFWNEIQITGDPARAVELTLSDAIEVNSYVSIYANLGPGFYNSGGTTDLTWTTITSNKAGSNNYTGKGGGVLTWGGTLTVRKSIISGNANYPTSANSDCEGTVTSGGYNLLGPCSGATAGTGGKTNTSASLSAPTFPSGSKWSLTPHHVPLWYSPAVNAIPSGPCAPLADDQIYNRRPTGSACDMGAIELQ
ncbi:MAG TPA: choice-of-anchor Q domain-containing protein [Fibrobacteria bacterium]|nr:choice-of-anchor Q domain-containing protein [Fibrobacteria bacterium]